MTCGPADVRNQKNARRHIRVVCVSDLGSPLQHGLWPGDTVEDQGGFRLVVAPDGEGWEWQTRREPG